MIDRATLFAWLHFPIKPIDLVRSDPIRGDLLAHLPSPTAAAMREIKGCTEADKEAERGQEQPRSRRTPSRNGRYSPMPITRFAKIVMSLALAAFCLLVAFDNVTDYGTNYLFVQHVLAWTRPFPATR